jgi:hypothetical protein
MCYSCCNHARALCTYRGPLKSVCTLRQHVTVFLARERLASAHRTLACAPPTHPHVSTHSTYYITHVSYFRRASAAHTGPCQDGQRPVRLPEGNGGQAKGARGHRRQPVGAASPKRAHSIPWYVRVCRRLALSSDSLETRPGPCVTASPRTIFMACLLSLPQPSVVTFPTSRHCVATSFPRIGHNLSRRGAGMS